VSRIHFTHLTSVGFEEFCFDLIRRVGFSNVDWRKGTPKNSSPADSGRDIVAFQRREDVDESHFFDAWFVDCKNYRRAVPPTELQNALAWAEAESPNVLLFIASGYFSNPAKDYLEEYRQNRKPRFRIKMWEKPQLELVIGGRRSLLYEYDLVKEKHKTRSLRQIQRAEQILWQDLVRSECIGQRFERTRPERQKESFPDEARDRKEVREEESLRGRLWMGNVQRKAVRAAVGAR
jgi:hypothetical protein